MTTPATCPLSPREEKYLREAVETKRVLIEVQQQLKTSREACDCLRQAHTRLADGKTDALRQIFGLTQQVNTKAGEIAQLSTKIDGLNKTIGQANGERDAAAKKAATAFQEVTRLQSRIKELESLCQNIKEIIVEKQKAIEEKRVAKQESSEAKEKLLELIAQTSARIASLERQLSEKIRDDRVIPSLEARIQYLEGEARESANTLRHAKEQTASLEKEKQESDQVTASLQAQIRKLEETSAEALKRGNEAKADTAFFKTQRDTSLRLANEAEAVFKQRIEALERVLVETRAALAKAQTPLIYLPPHHTLFIPASNPR